MRRGAGVGSGNTCGGEAGDLPGAVGKALVDAGVSKAAGEGLAIHRARDLRERIYDGHLADELDLDVGNIKLGEGDGAALHAVQLLGFGDDLAVGGGAEEVVGKQLVHGGNVVAELGLAPLVLERFNLPAHHPFGIFVLMVIAALGLILLSQSRYGKGDGGRREERKEQARC